MRREENKRKEDIFIKTNGIILNLLLQEERVKISDICKKTGLSLPHVINIVKRLENLGLLTTKKEKKFKYVALTENGIKIAEKIKEFINFINEEDLINLNDYKRKIKR
ncbi:MAG: helix-turn-helix domain-containing protein [Candidatus Micrarchaeia archaeon]